MSNYFKNVKSLDDLKAQFKKLVRENHPDAGKRKPSGCWGKYGSYGKN